MQKSQAFGPLSLRASPDVNRSMGSAHLYQLNRIPKIPLFGGNDVSPALAVHLLSREANSRVSLRYLFGSTAMPIYKIRGIDVEFPFEAYDCQIVYMEKVIQSLQEVRFQSITKTPFFEE